MDHLTHGGLFEGYGGTTHAARLALAEYELGLRTRWVSDIKPAAIALLDHHHPTVPNLGDMTAIDYRAVRSVEVLTTSWPCQPFSPAGKRLGEADSRALWPHVARAVEALRPAFVFGENVARVATNGELRRVVRSLTALGYVGAWRVLRASDVGAPHRRERCFVVAVDPASPHAQGLRDAHLSVRGDGAALAVEPVPGPGVGDRSGRAAPGVRELGRTPGELAARRDAAVHAATDGLTLLPTPKASDGPHGGPGMSSKNGQALPAVIARLIPTPTQSMSTGAGTSGREGGLNLQTAVTLLPTPSASAYGTNQGGAAGRVGRVRESLDTMARRDRFIDEWGVYAAAVRRWESTLGWSAPVPSQLADSYVKMLAKRRAGRDRRPVGFRGSLAPRRQLAPAFVEWMMGVAPGHVTAVPGISRAQQLSLLGDGVVPQQGAYAYGLLLGDLAERLAGQVAA